MNAYPSTPVVVQSGQPPRRSAGLFILVVVLIFVGIYLMPGILGMVWSEAKVVGIWVGEDPVIDEAVTYTFGWLGTLTIKAHLPDGDVTMVRDYLVMDESTMRIYLDEFEYVEVEFVATLTNLALTNIDPDTGEPSTDPDDFISLTRSYGLYF